MRGMRGKRWGFNPHFLSPPIPHVREAKHTGWKIWRTAFPHSNPLWGIGGFWTALFLLPIWGLGGLNAQSFKNLEKALQNPTEVRELILRRDKLQTVPVEIAQFQNLEILDLSKNDLDSLSLFLLELKNLKVLILSKNNIQNIPTFLSKNKNLEELILDRNPIKKIPAKIEGFQNLKVLDLWDSELDFIHPNILNLENLERLDVRNTYFKTEDLRWIKKGLPDLELQSSFGCDCD